MITNINRKLDPQIQPDGKIRYVHIISCRVYGENNSGISAFLKAESPPIIDGYKRMAYHAIISAPITKELPTGKIETYSELECEWIDIPVEIIPLDKPPDEPCIVKGK